MSAKTCALAVSAVLLSALSAGAQPTRVQQFQAWGVYSYGSGEKKTCYALSVPTAALPASVNHGDNFFIVAPQSGASAFMPQAIMGYGLKEGSRITVDVGSDNFIMVPKDKAAWVRDPAREPALITAMRGGTDMTVKAVSGRGTNTTYTYSLKGVTAALQAVRTCR
ncbi:invasion associated locus B family protein [Rhizobium sp. SSA_523]|uniref:invasion associated locus B family protein n=1 Tax=Rhizobium sp. SSA_523 TaxID=2952477 RepID=UPI00209049B5|nr:invasion associated locus B family protein [Rhizobium sp. SSA_523]MCO5730523.1 invasion associated locus B family protein [Rhizobium sp. SSA_523]WKC25562.1 invasion associated locus B family protein [Rhizobium sp. SSA_523]